MRSILLAGTDDDVLAVMARLQRIGRQITTATDSDQIMRVVRTSPPDLIVLHSAPLLLDSIATCQALRQHQDLASIPVLFVAPFRDVQEMVHAFAAGVDDYLAMPFLLRELELRIEALLRRVRHWTDQASHAQQVGSFRLEYDKLSLSHDGSIVRLTVVERDLLRCLMSRPGQVFAADTLLQEVWGYHPGTGDPALVRMHIHNLRHKIQRTPQSPQFIYTIPRHGYTVEAA